MSVVEPRTLAGFPLRSAKNAKLCQASAGHMITAFLPLHKRAAAVAALPAFVFSLLNELRNLRIFRTIGRFVHLVIA